MVLHLFHTKGCLVYLILLADYEVLVCLLLVYIYLHECLDIKKQHTKCYQNQSKIKRMANKRADFYLFFLVHFLHACI